MKLIVPPYGLMIDEIVLYPYIFLAYKRKKINDVFIIDVIWDYVRILVKKKLYFAQISG